jgi:DnaK suppressor protein
MPANASNSGNGAGKAPSDAAGRANENKPLVLPDDQLRKVKTGLTKRDLDHFRKLLMEKRAELLGDVASLQTDTQNNGGNLSNMPLHMADVGSDNYEQEFTLGLMESERKILREIDEALDRIKRGTYGVCPEAGTAINRARLDAKPWAKYCIEVARERERFGQGS